MHVPARMRLSLYPARLLFGRIPSRADQEHEKHSFAGRGSPEQIIGGYDLSRGGPEL
jgi:hypothetical protein